MSSFVTSVMPDISLRFEVKKVRTLECSVGSIARSVQESGVGGVVCSIGGSGSDISGGGGWVLHGTAAGGSAV